MLTWQKSDEQGPRAVRAHYHGKSDAEAAGSVLPAGGRLSRVGACEAASCQHVAGENMMTGVSSRWRKAEKVKQAWNTLAWQEHVVGNSGSWTMGREQSAGSGKEHSSMEQGGRKERSSTWEQVRVANRQ